jgi:uncharacterized repeat protein (TIGR03803 family)
MVALCLATAGAVQAQTFTLLARFDVTNGAEPYYGALIQGIDGNFWGTTETGGLYTGNGQALCQQTGCGTVFKISPKGKLTTVYNFCQQTNCVDGIAPYYGLVQDTAGNFFGTTYYGGSELLGNLFELTPQGQLTNIHSFCTGSCDDGRQPSSDLIEDTDGNFYGASSFGGVIYEVTPSGDFTFKPASAEGYGLSPFIEATDGHFWGIGHPGENHEGSIATITKSGEYQTLHSFCSKSNCTDGSEGNWLMQAADGNFYGNTLYGGANDKGVVFKFTPSGHYSIVYNFCSLENCADGGVPYGSLIQGTDGNFYGTTTFGGVAVVNGQIFDGYGTVFQLTPEGVLTTLYTFCSQGGKRPCSDGAYPLAGLVQGTDGNFYGTTDGYGPGLAKCPGSCGTVFKISMGLAPFVKANPGFGEAGREVIILGNNLTGTTSVTFNGVAATFKVMAESYIKATVPSGATTGSIEVTTPNGTLKSNVAFQVLP